MYRLKVEIYLSTPSTVKRRRELPVARGTLVASALVELPAGAHHSQLLAAVRAAFSIDGAVTLPEFARVGAGSTGEFSPAAHKYV